MKRDKRKLAGGLGPRQQQNWDWRAAANFIAGGAGGGALLAAAGAAALGADVRVLIAVGLALIGAGLTCVWFEIGRPWRALNVYRHVATSWMTREAAVAPLAFAFGAAAFYVADPFFALLAGLTGIAFVYAQARILAADKGIPAWRHRRALPLVVSTGLAEGAGLVALAAPWLLAGRLAPVAVALVALVGLRSALWYRYLAALRAEGAPEGSLRAFAAIDGRFTLAGHAAPAALALVALTGLPGAGVALAAAGALALASGWDFKYTLVRRAAFTQGFALPHLPVRGRGEAGPAVKPGWGGAG